MITAEKRNQIIQISGFKDDIEQEVYFKKIEQLLKESKMRVKVY